jgi:hypothetical protein
MTREDECGELVRPLLGLKVWVENDCACGCSMGLLSGSGSDVVGVFCLNCQQPLRRLSREATANLSRYVEIFGRWTYPAPNLRDIQK